MSRIRTAPKPKRLYILFDAEGVICGEYLTRAEAEEDTWDDVRNAQSRSKSAQTQLLVDDFRKFVNQMKQGSIPDIPEDDIDLADQAIAKRGKEPADLRQWAMTIANDVADAND